MKGSKADNILRRAEKQLLGVRIGDTVRKLKFLEEKKEKIEQEISRRLPRKSHDVMNFVEQQQVQEHLRCKQTQQKKFASLMEKKSKKVERKGWCFSI